MQNPGNYRFFENFDNEERVFNDNIASVIDSDYVMNYLNDPDSAQRRQPNLFGQVLPDIQYSYQGFPDQFKGNENLQNLYGKLNMQEGLMMNNTNDPTKMQFEQGMIGNYKAGSTEDIDMNTKVKKMKTNKESEVKKVSESNKSNKNNIKNTYINKINSLNPNEKVPPPEKNVKIKVENPLKSEGKKGAAVKNEVEGDEDDEDNNTKQNLKKVRSCDVLKSDDLEKLNIKLAKNRESARNSRIRKKVYIDLLEKTVEQLQQDLSATRSQLETQNSAFPKVIYQAKPVSNLFSARSQLFERLEKMLQSKADESEISFLVDSLRLRFGASGKDRVDVVNYMFKQILEYLVPVHMRYLLWIAGQGKDLFNPSEQNQPNSFFAGAQNSENTEYWTELTTQMNLSENQKKQMLRHKKKLLSEKTKFEALVANLNQARKNVLKQATNLQTVIDEFRNYLSPSQTAKLLLILEREKNRKEFRPELLWSGITMKKESAGDEEVSDGSDGFLEGEDKDLEDFDDKSISDGSGGNIQSMQNNISNLINMNAMGMGMGMNNMNNMNNDNMHYMGQQ